MRVGGAVIGSFVRVQPRQVGFNRRQVGAIGGKWGQAESSGVSRRQVGAIGGKWKLSETSGFIRMQAEESVGACGVVRRQLEVKRGHCCSCGG